MIWETIFLIFFLLFPLYYIVQVIQHEGSHAAMGLLLGGTVTEYSIRPTWAVEPSFWHPATWIPEYFGYVYTYFDPAPSWAVSAAVVVAPFISSFLMILVLSALLLFVQTSPVLYSLLMVPLVWNVIDSAFGMLMIFIDREIAGDADIWQAVFYTGLHPWIIKLFAIVWSGLVFNLLLFPFFLL